MAYLSKGFLRAANRPNELYCRVDPTPYLGLVFTLLCIFMLNPPTHHQGRGLLLVRSAHSRAVQAAVREDTVRISITRDGNFYFRNDKMLPDDLPNAIRDAMLNGSEKKIYLAVDSRAEYGDINTVIEQIRLTGIEQVCLLTC